MKRFWVFVIICVVALGIGFTVFRFMTLDELIYVNKATYEINAGETFKLEVVKEHLKSGTVVTASSSNESVVMQSDTDKNEYQFTAVGGGSAVITIQSNSKGFSAIQISVSVGNGSITNPFYIKDKETFTKVGKAVDDNSTLIYPLDKNYKLTADIDMTGTTWTPIGNGTDAGFTGQFDFDGHRISNLSVNNAFTNAGIFSKIGVDGSAKNLLISNFVFEGDFDNAGAVAGINLGGINNVTASNITITGTKASSNIGGLVGLDSGKISKSAVNGTSTVRCASAGTSVGGLVGKLSTDNAIAANLTVCYAQCNVSGNNYVGGLVGLNNGGIVENCFAGDAAATYKVGTTSSNAYVGGIIGYNQYAAIEDSSPVKAAVADCYAVVDLGSTGKRGAILGGNLNINDSKTNEDANIIYGNYYATDKSSGATGLYNVADATQLGGKVGIYGKTLAELQGSQEVYFSYYDSEDNQKAESWQFAKGIWRFVETTLPTLNFDCTDFGTRTGNARVKGYIYQSNFYSVLSNATSSDSYELKQDIELDSSTYTPFDFAGTLSCAYSGSEIAYTITLNIDNNSYDGYVALFRTLQVSAKLDHIKLVVTLKNLSSGTHFAGLVAVNKGNVESCVVSGSVATASSVGNVYIGGIVAENNGTINNSSSSVKLSYAKDANYFIGGVVGYNTGDCISSYNTGLIEVSAIGMGQVGGICGSTTGKIELCKNSGEVAGNTSAGETSYYGGIVGVIEKSSTGSVLKSKNEATITGSNVGGIAGKTSGKIENCIASSTLKGKNIGGLVFSLTAGTITNCLSSNSLRGSASDSLVAGFICKFDGLSSDNATCAKMQTCFSGCTFEGSGTNYYESSTKRVRGFVNDSWLSSSSPAINVDAMNYCIYVVRDANDIVRETWSDVIHYGSGNGSYDRQISETDATSGNVTDAYGFGEYNAPGSFNPYIIDNAWTFVSGSYPKPSSCKN